MSLTIDDVFIPTDRSPESARRVMAQAAQLSAESARRQPRTINAVAAATTQPPDATEVFFTYVGELMDAEGLSRAQAMRQVAIERPHLHAAYIAQLNAQARDRDQRERGYAAAARARRNAR